MHPILIDFGPFSLHSYGLMMAIAFAVGIWIATKRAPRRNLDGKFILDLAVISLIAGLVGARITYIFTHLDEFRGRWIDTISPVQADGRIGIAGLVLLGGVVVGFGAAYVVARRKNVSFLAVTDLLMPSLALGIAFGRIGCFLNGCCFGLPGNESWCMVFPDESLAGSVYPHVHIHPTQLYEVLAMLLVSGYLLWFDRKPRAAGVPTGLFLILYGVWRFYVEGLRWYEEGMILGMIGDMRFTFSRLISLLMIVAGLYLMLRARREKPA